MYGCTACFCNIITGLLRRTFSQWRRIPSVIADGIKQSVEPDDFTTSQFAMAAGSPRVIARYEAIQADFITHYVGYSITHPCVRHTVSCVSDARYPVWVTHGVPCE
jgi:hypothetical protein